MAVNTTTNVSDLMPLKLDITDAQWQYMYATGMCEDIPEDVKRRLRRKLDEGLYLGRSIVSLLAKGKP